MSRGILILSLLLSAFKAQEILAESHNQRVTLYMKTNCEGPGLIFQNQYVPHLATHDWNDVTYSVKVTGNWLFYDNKYYNEGSNASTEYIFGTNQHCQNLRKIGGKLTSVRFVGDNKDYRINSVTLYKDENFQGPEEFTMGDLENVYLKQHRSLIITGTAKWTLYDLPSYRGNSICVDRELPTVSEPKFVSNIYRQLNRPFNSIRSIKLGCDDTEEPKTDSGFNGLAP